MSKRILILLSAIVAFSFPANAATILSVDLSVTDQITITTTGGASSVTTTGSDTTGVYLAGIFASPFTAGISDTLVSGDLTSAENTSDGTPLLFTSTFTTGFGLNLWSYTDDPDSEFVAGSLAFSGSATWDISSADYAALLAGNLSGDVYAFADDDSDLAGAMVIGQWEVSQVPVPAAVWLFASALFGFGAFGSRKKS